MWTEDVHKTYKFCKNRAKDPPLRDNYIGKFRIFFSFGGRKPLPLNRPRSNLAGRSGSSLPNLTLIGTAWRKTPKIGSWVKTIPAELPAADPAGNDYFESMQYRQDLFAITHYHKRKHFPSYTRCTENHNTCAENWKIRGLKFDTLYWRHLAAYRKIWT